MKEQNPSSNLLREISDRRQSFRLRERVRVSTGGYGFQVDPGDLFRLVLAEGPQIVDLCILNKDDPTEHFASGIQFAIEGGHVTRSTRVWGSPPKTRPLCVCTADTVRQFDNPEHTRDHISHGSHCNPHHWALFSNRMPSTCYDNLSDGMRMVDLDASYVHDNMNLFQKTAIDPYTGQYVLHKSDAEQGDYLEFYALLPLYVVLSLCPYGDGSAEPREWNDVEIPVRALDIESYGNVVNGLSD